MPESVYISSTYKDLVNFRQAAINCIISLVDYYKPVSMEFYDAEDVHFVKKCQDDVANCNIYILILGKRYGYRPKGFTKSITELEYEKAVECQKNKGVPEILVFKIGDMCNTYHYEESDDKFVQYQESFLDIVTERLSPRNFDSEAEFALQLSLALMKRLFRLIRAGEKIVLPDKDAILCYCDRKPALNDLRVNLLKNKKKVFFLSADRFKDYPGGIVKRFAKYALGSVNRIDPFIQITDIINSIDEDNNIVNACIGILDYLRKPYSDEENGIGALINILGRTKSNKIVLPFYYDFDFKEDINKFKQFLNFLNLLFIHYARENRSFELYAFILIYSQQPDRESLKSYVNDYDNLKNIAAYTEKLSTVSDNHIIDWLEEFITTDAFSAALYQEYFKNQPKNIFMQEANLQLADIIKDLTNGNEKITKYI